MVIIRPAGGQESTIKYLVVSFYFVYGANLIENAILALQEGENESFGQNLLYCRTILRAGWGGEDRRRENIFSSVSLVGAEGCMVRPLWAQPRPSVGATLSLSAPFAGLPKCERPRQVGRKNRRDD